MQSNRPDVERNSTLTRMSLLARLRDFDDQASWQDFFDTYWRLIYNTALKGGLTDAEAQDAVQETIVSVARYMPGFTPDRLKGSFRRWLLQLTRWRITDQLRKRQVAPAAGPFRREPSTETGTLERQPRLRRLGRRMEGLIGWKNLS